MFCRTTSQTTLPPKSYYHACTWVGLLLQKPDLRYASGVISANSQPLLEHCLTPVASCWSHMLVYRLYAGINFWAWRINTRPLQVHYYNNAYNHHFIGRTLNLRALSMRVILLKWSGLNLRWSAFHTCKSWIYIYIYYFIIYMCTNSISPD